MPPGPNAESKDANRHRQDDPVFQSLSDRELQVFSLVGRGRPTSETAETLRISPRTVDSHKEHIKKRIGIAQAAERSARGSDWVSTLGLNGYG